MNAPTTNALTNGLHALCLFIYLVAAVRAARRGDGNFTATVAGFFLLAFVMKMMGVFVHYSPGTFGVKVIWAGIAIGIIIQNYLILLIVRLPKIYCLAGVLFSLGCTVAVALSGRFNFMAVEIAVISFVATLRTRGVLRLGFAGVVAANLFWLAAREGVGAFIGYEVPTVWRYDNDLYHLMLIVSTYLIYRGFARGGEIVERRI